MTRLPDIDDTLATVGRIASAPTAPYHEHRVMRVIAAELAARGIEPATDLYGQLHAHPRSGTAAHSFALVAHTDHPAFDVIQATGRTGRARILGGFYARSFARAGRVLVCDDAS